VIRDVKVSPDNLVSFTIALTVTGCPLKARLKKIPEPAVMKMEGVKDVHITLSEMTADERQSVFSKTAPQGPRLKKI
jgi:ATP-binding protein involved in chromosome partitioning